MFKLTQEKLEFIEKFKKVADDAKSGSAAKEIATFICELMEIVKGQDSELSSLRLKLESAEKDAERYRWLRESSDDVCAVRIDYYSDEYTRLMRADELGGEELDFIIDEALRTIQGEQGK